MTGDVLTAYEALLADSAIESDPAQADAVAELARLATEVVEQTQTGRSIWKFWGSAPKAIPGLYLWGGVGRGKTFLMDLFYSHLQEPRKKRVHFYRFMREVHVQLGRFQGAINPLEQVAAHMAEQARVLCFDEFFVSDITDAMILSGILEGLYRRNVTLVATSNLPPHELYKDGLQRRKFLPAIALLEQHNRILNVDGGFDYRMRSLTQAPSYYEGLTQESDQALSALFKRLTAEHEISSGKPTMLRVAGREISTRGLSGDVVWFGFKAICEGPRSQNDYIEVAEQFGTVLISEVPQFSIDEEDQARRFISLVDEFYDRHVKLVMSAEAAIPDLYQGRRLRFEFERTQSRLLEMQSTEYLGSQHLV